jgi:3-oxoacyl-[acyl-carrier protein] reductase
MGVLDGRGLIVTGADRSMGRAVVQAARDAGARVLACEHRPGRTIDDKPDDKPDDRPDDDGIAPVLADLADEFVVDGLFDLAADRMAPNVLANVVHPGDGETGLARLSEDGWNDALVTSLHTSVLMIQRAAGEFICGDGGRIVNVIDLTDHTGTGGVAAVARSALLSLSRCVAKEYGKRNVACSTVVAARDTRGAGGSIEDAANAVVYLASGEASLVTGDALHVTIRARATGTADQERARC